MRVVEDALSVVLKSLAIAFVERSESMYIAARLTGSTTIAEAAISAGVVIRTTLVTPSYHQSRQCRRWPHVVWILANLVIARTSSTTRKNQILFGIPNVEAVAFATVTAAFHPTVQTRHPPIVAITVFVEPSTSSYTAQFRHIRSSVLVAVFAAP